MRSCAWSRRAMRRIRRWYFFCATFERLRLSDTMSTPLAEGRLGQPNRL
jgi:hypothetical protein